VQRQSVASVKGPSTSSSGMEKPLVPRERVGGWLREKEASVTGVVSPRITTGGRTREMGAEMNRFWGRGKNAEA